MGGKSVTLPLSRPLAVIDVETTGVEPDIDRIVQIGLVRVYEGGGRMTNCWMVDPGIPIPPEATEIHGITDAMVKDAEPFAMLWPRIASVISECDVCAYNAKFDLTMLEAECMRNGIAWQPPERVIDPYRIFLSRVPHTLEGAVRFYLRRPHENAHSASADCIATLEVLKAQALEYGLGTVEQLIKASMPAKDPRWVDSTRKFYWRFGTPAFAFGKHRGRPLAEVARSDSSYLGWMLSQDYGNEVDGLIRDAMQGRIPSREGED
jgi:DNA polymerase-3 subunit epsilon